MRRFLLTSVLSLFCVMPLSASHAVGDDKLGIAAVVDDQIVSTIDLEDRISFVIGTTGLSDTPEVRQKLRPQILRTLVDEVLQLRESARFNIVVTDDEVDQAIASIERQHGKEPGSFQAHLEKKNLSRDTFANQIRAQVSWSKLIIKKFRNRVHISDEEVQRMLTSMAAGTTTEWKIASLTLPIDTPSADSSVKKLAEKLVSELNRGADFTAVASQVSSGKASAESNPTFWVKSEQLDKAVADKVTQMKPGQISKPIRTLGGYQIIKLYDKRATKALEPTGDAQVAIKQIILRLKADAKEDEVDVLMTIAKAIKKAPGACADKAVAGFKNTDIADIEVVFKRAELSRLSPELRQMVGDLKVGGVSEPFATPRGLQLLQVCERKDIPFEAVQVEKIKDIIFQQKMELEAEKYLRNLRREAFVDNRL